jgi:hypothetical protein
MPLAHGAVLDLISNPVAMGWDRIVDNAMGSITKTFQRMI